MRKYLIWLYHPTSLEYKINRLQTYWSSIDEDELFQKAKIDEMETHIAYILKHTEIKYNPWWLKEENLKKYLLLLIDQLDAIASILEKDNIEVIALKNAGILKGIYSNYSCSPMGDIDLLIRPKNFKKAHKILTENLGYRFKYRSELEKDDYEQGFKSGGTEYFKIIDGKKFG